MEHKGKVGDCSSNYYTKSHQSLIGILKAVGVTALLLASPVAAFSGNATFKLGGERTTNATETVHHLKRGGGQRTVQYKKIIEGSVKLAPWINRSTHNQTFSRDYRPHFFATPFFYNGSHRKLLQSTGSTIPSNTAPAITYNQLGGCQADTYIIGVDIANSPTIIMEVDTGSADITAASTNCDASCINVGNDQDLFPFTAQDNSNIPGSVSYGTGRVQGTLFYKAITVPSQPAVTSFMLAITSQNGFFNPTTCYQGVTPTYPYAGLLGLGLDQDARFSTYALISLLAQQGTPPVFSTIFCYQGGAISFGGYDPGRAAGPVQFTSMTTNSPLRKYFIQVQSIAFNGVTYPFNGMDQFQLPDTGSNFLALPGYIFTPLIQALDAAAYAAFNLPSPLFSGDECLDSPLVGIAEFDQGIPPLQYNFLDMNGQPWSHQIPSSSAFVFAKQRLDSPGDWIFCNIVNLQPATDPFTVYPMTNMNQAMTVWDLGNLRFGIAPVNPC
jgi:hypothetical protein